MSTPTSVLANPFDQMLNSVASVLARDLTGTGNKYGANSPTFTTLASGVACRVGILSVGTDRELLAKSKEDVAFRKVYLRPWYQDQSPDGSSLPNWVYNSVTYNTQPLTHDHWFLIDGENYDIFELRNPGLLYHHLEALCRIIEA